MTKLGHRLNRVAQIPFHAVGVEKQWRRLFSPMFDDDKDARVMSVSSVFKKKSKKIYWNKLFRANSLWCSSSETAVKTFFFTNDFQSIDNKYARVESVLAVFGFFTIC